MEIDPDIPERLGRLQIGFGLQASNFWNGKLSTGLSPFLFFADLLPKPPIAWSLARTESIIRRSESCKTRW
jgi:hypothetical protein